ncbi:MAG: Rrf2 family transcriptional regulator [Firmicutes bacterium HGW-Firmicutes-11]|nr:MAG: Rrf2 family transcriptional regulator [Firmicutes bacterium HGW-Firmicutes-11]
MRISTKGRYGVASMICLVQDSRLGDPVTILSISERLGISKIYLEQVFALLKRANLLSSTKGSQGGYRLSLPPDKITLEHILRATEASLFEPTERSVPVDTLSIELAMEEKIWNPLDRAIAVTLGNITLAELVTDVEKRQLGNDFMYFI